MGNPPKAADFSAIFPGKVLPKRRVYAIKEEAKCEERENSDFAQPERGAATGCKPSRRAPLGSPGSGLREQDGFLRRYRRVSARPAWGANAGGTAEGLRLSSLFEGRRALIFLPENEKEALR